MAGVLQRRNIRAIAAVATMVGLVTSCTEQAFGPILTSGAQRGINISVETSPGRGSVRKVLAFVPAEGLSGRSEASGVTASTRRLAASVDVDTLGTEFAALRQGIGGLLGDSLPAADPRIAPAGIARSNIAVDTSTGTRAYTNSLRDQPGAPPSKTEVVVNGKVVFAMSFDRTRRGHFFVTNAFTAEWYDGDSVVLRMSYANATTASSSVAPTVLFAPSSDGLGSLIRSKRKANASFGRAGLQDLCESHNCPLIKPHFRPRIIRASLAPMVGGLAAGNDAGEAQHAGARIVSSSRRPDHQRPIFQNASWARSLPQRHSFASARPVALELAGVSREAPARMCDASNPNCTPEWLAYLSATAAAVAATLLAGDEVVSCVLTLGIACIGLSATAKAQALALAALYLAVAAAYKFLQRCYASLPAT